MQIKPPTPRAPDMTEGSGICEQPVTVLHPSRVGGQCRRATKIGICGMSTRGGLAVDVDVQRALLAGAHVTSGRDVCR